MVTVLMPVFNGERFLSEAIDSILNQSFKNFEFLIINDGSTDNSESIIKGYHDLRIKYVSKKNEGVSKTLNYGIQIAKYNYIARMDCDDIATQDRIKIQLDFMIKNPKFVLVGGSAVEINEEGEYIRDRITEVNEEKIRERLPFTSFISPTVMFRKDVAKQTNGYPEEINKGEDAIFFYRMCQKGSVINLPNRLLNYRVSRFSLSPRDKKSQKIINECVLFYAKNNYINDVLLEKFNSIEINLSKDLRLFNYYRYLSVCYTLNNYQFRKSISYLVKSYKVKQTFFIELLVIPIFLIFGKKTSNSIISVFRRI